MENKDYEIIIEDLIKYCDILEDTIIELLKELNQYYESDY